MGSLLWHRRRTEAHLLEVRNLTKRFGGLVAINDLSLTLRAGQLLGVIGPNGAGKTTLLNLITGYLPPTSGSIEFEGHSVVGYKPYEICRVGIARTFQVVQPLAEMTVLENVALGALFSGASRASLAEANERAMDTLALVGLEKHADAMAGALTLGDKKKLELARALATQPRILLLDEVMAGSSQREVTELMEVLRSIHAGGTTILMIEHLVHVVLELADHVFVLNFGQELYQGRPDDVVAHPEVIESYLGKPLQSAADD
jgi:branched-chain amino acid transport system ATP-binding protein